MNHNDNHDGQTEKDRLNAMLALIGDDEKPVGSKPDLQEIQAWHQNKLDATRALEVKTHVARDPECYQLWSDLLAEDKAAVSKPGLFEQIRDWLGTTFAGNGTQLTLALTAVMVLAISIPVIMNSNHGADDIFQPGAVRGSGETEYRVKEPQVAIKTLVEKVEAKGADVLVVRLNKNTWSVVINTPSKDSRREVIKVLVKLGIKQDVRQTLRVIIKKK